MKTLKLLLATLAFAAVATTSAQARDSFSLGINIGGYGYAPPPVVYYPAPARVYYDTPTVYYSAPPVISYRYYNYGHRDYDWGRGYDRHNNWGHRYYREGRGHGGERWHGDGHR
jgi:hypothetical protein